MGRLRPIIPIPPSYTETEELETNSTKKYLNYLEEAGIREVMTTAGTSQFNLLSIDEIHSLNNCIVSNFTGKKILGVPLLSTKKVKVFIKDAQQYINNDCHFLVSYPDRFYNYETIISYLKDIVPSNTKVYLHCIGLRSGIQEPMFEYSAELLNILEDLLVGIKEELLNISDAKDMLTKLTIENFDVIVAGGSISRYEQLKTTGVSTFLGGIGSIFPKVELNYCNDTNREQCLLSESKLFKIFYHYGWHRSLREALRQRKLTCFYNRKPWPFCDTRFKIEIEKIIKELSNEK